MNEIAAKLYTDLNSPPPAPLKWIPGSVNTDDFSKFTINDADQLLENFPTNFPPSCPILGESSSPNLSTTTYHDVIDRPSLKIRKGIKKPFNITRCPMDLTGQFCPDT
jgi:hypothetical protein